MKFEFAIYFLRVRFDRLAVDEASNDIVFRGAHENLQEPHGQIAGRRTIDLHFEVERRPRPSPPIWRAFGAVFDAVKTILGSQRKCSVNINGARQLRRRARAFEDLIANRLVGLEGYNSRAQRFVGSVKKRQFIDQRSQQLVRRRSVDTRQNLRGINLRRHCFARTRSGIRTFYCLRYALRSLAAQSTCDEVSKRRLPSSGPTGMRTPPVDICRPSALWPFPACHWVGAASPCGSLPSQGICHARTLLARNVNCRNFDVFGPG